MAKIDTLKHCPFCGSNETGISEGSSHRWWLVSCWNCGAQGGDARTKEDAIKEWNTRYSEGEQK